MHFDVACVYHQPFKNRLTDQDFKESFPVSFVSSTAKPVMVIFPVSIIWREIPPGSCCAQNPKDSVDKQAIVAGSDASDAITARQMRFQKFTKPVRYVVAGVCRLHIFPIFSEKNTKLHTRKVN